MDEVKSCCEVDHSQHQSFEEETDLWDKIGIALSGLCAVHCLVTPFLVLSLPVLGQTFEQPWVHLLMALFIVPIGLFAFYSGYLHHKNKKLAILGLSGLSLVGLGLLVPFSAGFTLGHDIFTIVGSVFLIIAHVLNRRACLCHKH